MKIMTKELFKNLIHDLGYTSHQTFKLIQTYDNIRVIGLQQVDNKQYYNICLLDEQGNDIDAKITYVPIADKIFVSYEKWKKQQEGYIDTDNIKIEKFKIDNDEVKTAIFKLEVFKLMIKYDLCISHEDEHGAFKIIPYNQVIVEWFTESEFNKK